MGRIIAAVSLSGWLAIVAIAYRLAERRIGMCLPNDFDCQRIMTTQRDTILTGGLAVALFIVIAAMVSFAISARRGSTPVSRSNGWTVPASRGNRALPR